MSPCQVLPSLWLGNPPSVGTVGNFVFVIFRVLATVLLVLFGLGELWFGIYIRTQRERMDAVYRGTDMEEGHRRFQRCMPWAAPLLGITCLAASIFVWLNPILAVVILALPFVVRFFIPPVPGRR